jgi:hypothetical protein
MPAFGRTGYPSTGRITSHERSIERNGSKRPDPPRKQIDGCDDDSDSDPHRHPVRSGPFNSEIDTEGQEDKPPATTLDPPAGKRNSKLSLIGVSNCAPKHDASPGVNTLWGESSRDSLTNAPLSLFQYVISRGRWHTRDPYPELESIHQRFATHVMSITHNVRLACRSRGAGPVPACGDTCLLTVGSGHRLERRRFGYEFSGRRMCIDGKPSKWSPAVLMVSAICAEAMCASKSSCDCHFSIVTNVAGTETEANSSYEMHP